MHQKPKSTIDQKIAALKHKKKKIQHAQAVILLKKLKQIFGKEYSHELVCAITSKTWHMANAQDKEVWRSSAHPFCYRNSVQMISARTKDPEQASGSSTKEVPTHDQK